MGYVCALNKGDVTREHRFVKGGLVHLDLPPC